MTNLIEEGIIQRPEPTGDLRDYFTTDEFNTLLDKSKPPATISRIIGAGFHEITAWPSKIATTLQQIRQESIPRYSKTELEFRDEQWIDKRLFADVSDSEAVKIRKNLAKTGKTGKALVDEKRKLLYERSQAKTVEKLHWLKTIEGAKIFQVPPEYKTSSSGFIEDVVRGFFGSLPDIAITAVNPPLGAAAMWANLYGSKYQNLEVIGVSPERARKASFLSASYQAPLELIGNLFQLKAIMKTKTGWQDVAVDALNSFLGEGATEIAQQYPDELTTFWALHPGLSEEEMRAGLIDVAVSPETFVNALYAGAVGGVSGSAMATVGGSLNYAINSKQLRLNQELEDKINVLITKSENGTLSNSDTADLYKLIGIPPEATEQEVKERIEDVKNRVFYQEPIESANRNNIIKNLSEGDKFTPEQIEAYTTIWDSIARSWAERTGNKPADWYQKYFGGFKQAKYKTFRVDEDDVFQGIAKEFNIPEEQLRKEFEETKAKYEGTDKWLKAPNGKPSNLNEHAWVLTHTPRFKEWFGDSKVVDENGEPLVVYHAGSFREAEDGAFIVEKDTGIHFGTEDAALSRVTGKEIDDAIQSIEVYENEDGTFGYEIQGGDYGGNYATEEEAYFDAEEMAMGTESDYFEEDMITKAYLSIKNPKKIKDQGADWSNAIIKAKKEGYDGIKYVNKFEDEGSISYVAFNPTQIKSIYNTGAFSKTDPDIRYQTPEKQQPQGAITNLFNNMPKVIAAFETANVSTPIHETGHLLTQMMWENEDKTDYYVLTDSMGIPPDRAEKGTQAWTTEEIEYIAKAFERYMMEGKAPTHRLQIVFAKMKEWFLSVYRSVKALGVELKPEVREVFDKWLTVPAEYADFIYNDSAEWFRVDDAGLPKDYEIQHDRADMEEYEKITAKARALTSQKLQAQRQAKEKKLREVFFNNVKSAIKKNPSQKDAIQKYYDDLWAEYQKYSVDLNTPETYEDYINAEIDTFMEMLSDNAKPKVRKELKKIIRETTGQIKDHGLKQLKEDLKRDEQVARKAWIEGKKEGKANEKEKGIERLQKVKDAKIEAILKLKAKQKARIIQIRLKFKESKRRERIVRSLRKSINQKNISPQHAAQIQAVLSPYYKFAEKKETLVSPMPWPDYLESLVDSGDEAAASALSNLIFNLPDPKLKIIPIDGLEKIYQIVKIIKHISKVEQQLLAAEEKQLLGEYVQERVNIIRKTFKDQSIGTPISPLQALREKDVRSKFLNSTSESISKYLAELKKAEFIFMDLDGKETMGKNHELFEIIVRAETAETILGEKTFDKIKQAFDPFRKNKGWKTEKFAVKGLNVKFTKEELIMIALNAGNKGNLNALKYGYGIEIKHIRWIRQHLLSDKEKQLVKDIWNIYEELYPLSNAVHKQMTGIPLQRIDGHYFPLKFDPEISDKAAGFEEAKNLRDSFATVAIPTFVRASSWKKRIGGRMPPWLSFEVINRTVREEIHAITHKVAVRDVQKVIKHQGYKKAVQDALGKHVYNYLPKWLDSIARPENPTQLEFEKWIYKIRRNITVAYLGWKVTVALKQPLSYSLTIDAFSKELGAKAGLGQAMKGLSLFYKNPKATISFVNNRSVSVANRRGRVERDMMLLDKQFSPMDKEKTIIKESFFAMIRLMDASVVYPTWIAAYDLAFNSKNKNGFGWDEQKAIEYADHIVRTTQPTSMLKDLANVQKGHGIQKIFSMFYTFFSVFYNALNTTIRKHKLGEINKINALNSYWWISIFPAIASGIIQRRRLQDGWEWLTDILSYNIAGLPFIRDILNPVLTGFDFTMSPIEGALETPAKAINVLKSKDPLSLKLVKTGISGVGAAKGIPSSAINLFVSGAVDLAEGDTKNPFRLVLPPGHKPKGIQNVRSLQWK